MSARTRIVLGAALLALIVALAALTGSLGGRDRDADLPTGPVDGSATEQEGGPAPDRPLRIDPAAPIDVEPYTGEPATTPAESETGAVLLRGVVRPKAEDASIVPSEIRVTTRFLGTDIEEGYAGSFRLAAFVESPWIPRPPIAPGIPYAIAVEDAGFHAVRLSAEGVGNVFNFEQSTSKPAEALPRLVPEIVFQVREIDRPDVEGLVIETGHREGGSGFRAAAADDGRWVVAGRFFLPARAAVRLRREPAGFTWNFSTSPVPLHLPPAPVLAVLVRAEGTGIPLAGALVEVGRSQLGREGGYSMTRVWTDARGAARLPMTPDREMFWHDSLAVSHPEAMRITFDREDFLAFPRSQDGALVIEVPAASGLRGRLVDEAGRPVAGAAVNAILGSTHYPMLTGHSDADGHFVVASATHQFVETRAAQARPASGTPPPAEPLSLCVIRRSARIPFIFATSLEDLERGDRTFACLPGITRGRILVVDTDSGAPIPGATVRLIPIVDETPLIRLSRWPPARTDARGVAVLGSVPANAWQLEIQAEGHARWRREVAVQDLSELTVPMRRDGHQILVRLVDGAGQPIAGGEVLLSGGPSGDLDERETADAAGHACLDVPGPGEYEYWIAAGVHRRASESNPETLAPRSEPYVLRMLGVAERDFRVVEPDGTEAPWAMMFVAPAGAPRSVARVRPWVSRRALLPMPKEPLSLWFATPRGLSAETAWNEEVWSGRDDVAVRLDTFHRVTGRLVLDRPPEAGSLTVTAKWLAIEGFADFGYFSDRTVQAPVARDTLRFAFDSLCPGRWLLTLALPGAGPIERRIDVPCAGDVILAP